MNDELAAIVGSNEDLVANLQEKHGIAKDEAKQQVMSSRKASGN
jgi:uncharacterized protein YjbJ (UPF0337 family)